MEAVTFFISLGRQTARDPGHRTKKCTSYRGNYCIFSVSKTSSLKKMFTSDLVFRVRVANRLMFSFFLFFTSFRTAYGRRRSSRTAGASPNGGSSYDVVGCFSSGIKKPLNITLAVLDLVTGMYAGISLLSNGDRPRRHTAAHFPEPFFVLFKYSLTLGGHENTI